MAYVYCVSSINAVSYACNTAVFVYVYFTVDGSNIAEQFYRCALAVSKFAYHTAHCTQGQFSIAVADGFDIFQVFVQLNLNLSAVIAYANVLIAAEINIVTGFYIGCFGCCTISRQIPACISSVAYFFQLAYIYCVSIGSTCCHAADFAVFIYGNLAVDYGSAALHVNRCTLAINNTCSTCCTIKCQLCITVGNRVAGYVNICQLAALISVYTVFGCNSAGSFNCTIGTADAYILTVNITNHNIIVQVYFINLLAINSAFFNISIGAIYYLAVLACFGCYCIQLAAVYCVSGICRNLTCCYAANFAVLVNDNLIIDFSITILQIYRCTLTVNNTCSTCCTIQCQFGITVADGLNVFQSIVQFNAYSSTFIAYADILVTAEVNECTGCYLSAGSSIAISGKCPACISSVAYFFQLAYVYCVSIGSTCCYAADFAVLVNDNLIIDFSITILQIYRCTLTINNACITCCTIKCQLSTAVDNGGNISQIACNINLVISLAVFNCSFNCCILAVRQGGMFKCFCFDIVQLAYVYSVFIRTTGSYTANGAILSYFYFTINFSTATHKAYRCLTVS